MIDRVIALPLWAKFLLGFLVLTFISSVSGAWGERRFLREIGIHFVAETIYWGRVVAGVALGAAASTHVYSTTKKMWLGVTSFVVVCMSVALTLTMLASAIPGVKGRLNAMSSDGCHIEYDGRSSWTEC